MSLKDLNLKFKYFSESSNETLGGMRNNFEKIDVYFKESEKERI